MAYELTETKKAGIGLIGFGLFFTFLAIVLFFDRGLLALGNIFSLAGVAILLGWRSTWALFTDRANYKWFLVFYQNVPLPYPCCWMGYTVYMSSLIVTYRDFIYYLSEKFPAFM
ncbi:vesicle transport protein GOT1 isoform X2 [Phaseolus vulgaris]|uniref:vesicle transport protein GOT1 isoform X2 n=1 Tax=Phaseolus vulgaris TaxID=3885 RepID=UPI0035CA4FF2